MINWLRILELKEFEATAGHVGVAGYCGAEALMDTSAPERPQSHKSSAGQKPGWAQLMRKILVAKAPRAETGLQGAAPIQGDRYDKGGLHGLPGRP